MTRDEWRDIVATMTPAQKEAMCLFAEAVADAMEGGSPHGDISECLDMAIAEPWGAKSMLQRLIAGPSVSRARQPECPKGMEREYAKRLWSDHDPRNRPRLSEATFKGIPLSELSKPGNEAIQEEFRQWQREWRQQWPGGVS